jgi:glycerol kinase
MMRSVRPPPAPLYLAIDQGGHASRALIVDAGGAIVSRAVRELAAARIDAGHIEYDAETMLASIRAAIGSALADFGGDRDRVAGAGLATQRSNVVCWDRESGAPLSPVISWQDRRDAGWLQRLDNDRDRVRRITGLPLSAHYGANKLRWCLNELPAVRRALREGRLAWGPMAGFLLFRLLRERPLRVDRVNAARTLLWDLAAGDWSETMLELFGLPRTPLPAAAPCRDAFGTLECDGPAIPLTVVTGDQSAALYAAGQPPDDALHVTVGTGAFVLRCTGAQAVPSPRLLSGILFDDGRTRTHILEGTVNGAGSALDWLARKYPDEDLASLPAWLSTVADPPLFLNGVSGLGTPWMIADAPVRFIGDGDIAARAVAVVESIAFLLQANIEALVSLPPRPEAIRIGGGLARLDGLCRRLADLSGLRVERGGEGETTCLGLAWLLRQHDPSGTAGVAPAWPDATRGADVFMPGADPRLQKRYRRWRDEIARALDERAGAARRDRARAHARTPRPAVVAHRGDAGRYPENTLPAIESALRAGLRHVEIDVQLTADGVPVLFHDDLLRRTTGAAGRITRTSWAELRDITAGEPARFGERFRDVRAPSLAAVIERLSAWPEARLFVEIKPESLAAFGVAQAVGRLWRVIEPLRGQCIVISFDANAVREASRLGAAEIGWVLTRCDTREIAAARLLAPDYLFSNRRKLPRGRVPAGPWRWVVYEVTRDEDARRLAARGVDMIETMQIERFVNAD